MRHRPSETIVTAVPPAMYAGSLPVTVVSGDPSRHHKHDPSDPITTVRDVVESTNAIARPFGEKRGSVGEPHNSAFVQIEVAAPVAGLTRSSPPRVPTTRSPLPPGNAPQAGDALKAMTAPAMPTASALLRIEDLNEPHSSEFRTSSPAVLSHWSAIPWGVPSCVEASWSPVSRTSLIAVP
jgi:hypothetical protein